MKDGVLTKVKDKIKEVEVWQGEGGRPKITSAEHWKVVNNYLKWIKQLLE